MMSDAMESNVLTPRRSLRIKEKIQTSLRKQVMRKSATSLSLKKSTTTSSSSSLSSNTPKSKSKTNHSSKSNPNVQNQKKNSSNNVKITPIDKKPTKKVTSTHTPKVKATSLTMRPEDKERLERGLKQRLFLVWREQLTSSPGEEFSVLGNTSNLYKVKITSTPKCNCRDFLFNRKTCKHLFFVLTRVLGLSPDSQLLRKKKYSDKEIEQLFNKPSSIDSTLEADDKIKEVYAALTGKEYKASVKTSVSQENSDSQISTYGIQRKPFDDSDCPICFEPMNVSEPLVWCQRTCGKSIHELCFSIWKKSTSQHRFQPTTCVYCRAPWINEMDIIVPRVNSYFNFSALM